MLIVTVTCIISGVLQLAAPILPICISCILSTVTIARSIKLTRRCRTVSHLKLEATITILVVTAVYIGCNIPVFIFWTIYIVDGFTVSRDNQFLYWYSWGLTYVVLVGCNAALNPVVMMCRISKMRDCLGNVMRFCGGKRGAVRLRSLRSCHEVEMTPAMGRNSVVNNVSELRRVSQLSVSGCSSQGSRASTVYLPINNRHT